MIHQQLLTMTLSGKKIKKFLLIQQTKQNAKHLSSRTSSVQSKNKSRGNGTLHMTIIKWKICIESCCV